MTCPAPHRLDAFLDGDLDAADAAHVREHVAACPTCGREAALARQVAGALADARAVRAPAGLAEAAIAEARARPSEGAPARLPARPGRAGDRSPSLQSRRGRALALAAFALAAVVAVATTWATLDAPAPRHDAPLVAEGVPQGPSTDAVPVPPPAEQQAEAAAPDNRPEAPTAPAPVQAAPAPLAEAPRPLAAPAPDAPAPEPIAQAAPAEEAPTAAEVEQAKEDLQLALSLVADAQRQAGRALRDEAGPLASTLDQTLPF